MGKSINRLARQLLLLVLVASFAFAAPRNVILMIGDGMGPDIVAAAGAYKYGADYYKFGGTKKLTMETLDKHFYMTTFCAGGSYDYTWKNGDREYPKSNPTDSGAAGTALASGVKTYDGAIGVGPDRKDVELITEYARKMGQKYGVVTSVNFNDATPAAFSTHNTSRNSYKKIAHDILYVNQPDVIVTTGGLSDKANDIGLKYFAKEDWDGVVAGKTGYKFVQSRADIQKLITDPVTGKLLVLVPGIYPLKPCNADGKSADPDQPTLKEMAQAALSNLANPKGFFVMIEGGNIDKVAHLDSLDETLGETLAFDDAIAATIEWINKNGGWEQNLLIITADHDTGYLNDVKPTEANKLPAVKWGIDNKGWGMHTNRLVDLYTMGKGSEVFDGLATKHTDFIHGEITVVDNTDVFKVMKAAIPVAENK
ncbi:MAG: alkaline phosphatase [bacterium]